MKKCSKCLLEKSLPEFYMRKTGERAGEYYEKCKICMKERGISYYHANHERQLKLANIRRTKARKIKRRFLDCIKMKPCADCGKIYPSYVMDFDHRLRSNKITDIATMVTKNWSLKKIQIEIEKCDIVCANCHRIRTFKDKALR